MVVYYNCGVLILKHCLLLLSVIVLLILGCKYEDHILREYPSLDVPDYLKHNAMKINEKCYVVVLRASASPVSIENTTLVHLQYIYFEEGEWQSLRGSLRFGQSLFDTNFGPSEHRAMHLQDFELNSYVLHSLEFNELDKVISIVFGCDNDLYKVFPVDREDQFKINQFWLNN